MYSHCSFFLLKYIVLSRYFRPLSARHNVIFPSGVRSPNILEGIHHSPANALIWRESCWLELITIIESIAVIIEMKVMLIGVGEKGKIFHFLSLICVGHVLQYQTLTGHPTLHTLRLQSHVHSITPLLWVSSFLTGLLQPFIMMSLSKRVLWGIVAKCTCLHMHTCCWSDEVLTALLWFH